MPQKNFEKSQTVQNGERGVSLVVAILTLLFLMGFVTVVLTMAVSETRMASNETAEGRSFAVAQAGLEDTTSDFSDLFQYVLSPTQAQIDSIQDLPLDGFNGFTVERSIQKVGTSKQVQVSASGQQGLFALRDEWQVDATATEDNSGAATTLRRRFFSDRIPIFQFGAFYEDDLELNQPPTMSFIGRVHTNGNLFLSSSSRLDFRSRVSATLNVINDKFKSSQAVGTTSDEVYFPNSTNTATKLGYGRGSVKCASGSSNLLIDNSGRNYPYPRCNINTNWSTDSAVFNRNLTVTRQPIVLPMARLNTDLIELIRLGGASDSPIIRKERFANKDGIRVTLADSQNQLPGCASVVGSCGARLDASITINGVNTIGYIPRRIFTTPYTTTPVNGARLRSSINTEVWIKIETVQFDGGTQNAITNDITDDILGFGVTEPAPGGIANELTYKTLPPYNYVPGQDSNSIIKLQRFAMESPTAETNNYVSTVSVGGRNMLFAAKRVINGISSNDCNSGCMSNDLFPAPLYNTTHSSAFLSSMDSFDDQHKIIAYTGSSSSLRTMTIVPFPINMFDTRESSSADVAPAGTTSIHANGVMSLIDIDVANLRRYLNGDFDASLVPGVTRGSSIPTNRGWVLYVSDRRGDKDNDGEYDMEDVRSGSNNLYEEDLNRNGAIENSTANNEAPTSGLMVDKFQSAVGAHEYYRRGVRLINAVDMPGRFDTTVESNTQGFTFASENGVYTQGNYNVNATTSTTTSTPSSGYPPFNTARHVPAAIVADSVTVLSSRWLDSRSFIYPYNKNNRVPGETWLRVGIIAGDTLTGLQDGREISTTFSGYNGGLNNLMRFLENWTNVPFRYSGSLVNLFNSRNSNGRFKCCTVVYNPPDRDWTFEDSFTNPDRLPPGTPYAYNLSFTGFERSNDF